MGPRTFTTPTCCETRPIAPGSLPRRLRPLPQSRADMSQGLLVFRCLSLRLSCRHRSGPAPPVSILLPPFSPPLLSSLSLSALSLAPLSLSPPSPPFSSSPPFLSCVAGRPLPSHPSSPPSTVSSASPSASPLSLPSPLPLLSIFVLPLSGRKRERERGTRGGTRDRSNTRGSGRRCSDTTQERVRSYTQVETQRVSFPTNNKRLATPQLPSQCFLK